MKNMKSYLMLAIVLALAACNSSAVQVLYYDNFDGPNGVDLNGRTPDITTAGATWLAGTWVNADGTYGGGSSNQMFTAALPFRPTIGAIYELSATVDNRGDWVGIAFFNAAPNVATRINDNAPLLWSLTRQSGSAAKDQAFIGPGTSGGLGSTATSSAAELKVRIEMNSTTDWLVTWYFDGSQQFQRTVNPTGTTSIILNYVAFGSNGLFSACTGTISSFKLVEIPSALKPNPTNGSLVYNTNVSLQWQPGIYAAKHDVYVGTSFADVNNAAISTPNIYKGRKDPNSFTLTNLTPGVTYYWRIDEVRADGTIIDKGDVWSFKIQPLIAYNPSPSNGAKYMDAGVDLAWSPGAKAKFHDIYLGTNFDNVSNASITNPLSVLKKQNYDANTYDPGTLSLGTDYYWRIDEVNGTSTWTGEVWHFKTMPLIPIVSPNLAGWWKFDEDQGTVALDWSGYGNHGILVDGPQWATTGQLGGALSFDGINDYVSLPIGSVINSLSNSTFAVWVNWARIGATVQRIFDFGTGTDVSMFLSPGNGGGGGVMQFSITTVGGNSLLTAPSTLAAGWHHVAVVIDGTNRTMSLYIDGILSVSDVTQIMPKDLGITTQNFLGRSQAGDYTWLIGLLDDFRIYNQALGIDQIGRIMTGDPLLAWNPRPLNGSTPQSENATPLSWSAGDKAAKHDVYFGIDPNAVADAGTSTAGIYRGRQSGTSYSPLEALVWGQTYYWRIDEYNTDATISTGRIWSFTVADYLLVDDFEDYNNFTPDRIFQTWLDGIGYSAELPYFPTGYGGNGTGAAVGHDIWSTGTPYTTIIETSIFHGGTQSMPVDYNNAISPYYSETTRIFPTSQDWTKSSVKALSLWFMGIPASVGSLKYDQATGTYTMTGSGADIWNTADEFHFAYKTLTGDCTIIARIDSITNTNVWAKAGVMIRETLDPGSPLVDAVISADGRAAMQWRTEQDTNMNSPDSSTHTVAGAFTLPHWIKLTRSGYVFTVQHSADGVTWQDIVPETAGDPLSMSLTMGTTVFVGLAITSHNTSATCEAKISNVSITTPSGSSYSPAGPFTVSQDIGIASNDPAPMYVTLEDDTGGKKTVNHPDDPNAVLQGTWQEWPIALSAFTDVKLDKIKKMTIGTGNKTAGGSGSLYFDDIRLYRSRCVPAMAKPAGDLNDDCMVDYLDVDILAGDWLLADEVITTTSPSATGLMGHWKFDGNANDSSGNGRNGTVNGSPQWAPVGHINGALSFDGTDDYVDLPIGSVIASMSNCTVATWVNFSNTGGAWQRIFDFGSDPNVYMFLSPRIETAGAMRFSITTSGNTAQSQITAPATLATGWHHVAVAIDGTSKNMQIYLDGVSVVSGTTQTLPKDLGNTTQNWLGRSQYATDAYLTGALDDFRIYNRVLSKSEVAYLGDSTPGDGQIYVPLVSDADLYSTEAAGSQKVNFKDFAVLAQGWLEEKLWP